MRIKAGAKLIGLTPQILLAAFIADELWKELHNAENSVLTENSGGEHKKGSLHYSGNAIDLRIWGWTKVQATAARNELAQRLGAEFDVILEKDHIHVEWQP